MKVRESASDFMILFRTPNGLQAKWLRLEFAATETGYFDES